MTSAGLVLEVLHSMYAVLVLPEHWTKAVSARNWYGQKVHPCNAEAECFCLIGARIAASEAVAGGQHCSWLNDATDWILNRATAEKSANGSDNYVSYNDRWRTTHNDIVALLEIAIAKQEAVVRG